MKAEYWNDIQRLDWEAQYQMPAAGQVGQHVWSAGDNLHIVWHGDPVLGIWDDRSYPDDEIVNRIETATNWILI